MLRQGGGKSLRGVQPHSLLRGAVNSKRVLVWKPEGKQNSTKQKSSKPAQDWGRRAIGDAVFKMLEYLLIIAMSPPRTGKDLKVHPEGACYMGKHAVLNTTKTLKRPSPCTCRHEKISRLFLKRLLCALCYMLGTKEWRRQFLAPWKEPHLYPFISPSKFAFTSLSLSLTPPLTASLDLLCLKPVLGLCRGYFSLER